MLFQAVMKYLSRFYGVPFRSKLFQVNKKYSNIISTCYNSQYNVENIKIKFKLKKKTKKNPESLKQILEKCKIHFKPQRIYMKTKRKSKLLFIKRNSQMTSQRTKPRLIKINRKSKIKIERKRK